LNTAHAGNFINGSIDANPANITNAIIPDILYGIGDTITATLTVSVDTDTYTLGVSSINGVSATNLQKINDTTYTLDYSMVEGHTDRASGTLPYSIVLIDSFANENPSYAGDFVDGAMDATRPVIASTYLTNGNYGIGDSMRLVVDSDGLEYSVFNITVNGQSINGFNDLGDTTYEMYYSVGEGDTDRTANTIPISVVIEDKAGNVNLVAFTSPSANAATIDAHRPEVLSISLSDTDYKIGDTIEATVTVTSDANVYSLGNTSINGVTAGNIQKINDTTYKFDITVGAGDIDRTAGNIPVSVILADQLGQENLVAFSTVTANTASIDANAPSVASISYLPNSGILTIGETATATVSMTGAETGVTFSSARINNIDISSSFSDLGGGDYEFVYVVGEGDDDHPENDDLPVYLVAVDAIGNTSSVYAQTDPLNRPGVDANKPSLTNVTFDITSGLLKVGDTAVATIFSDDTGYSAGAMTINGVDVSGTLVDVGDGTYTVSYNVLEGHTDILDSSDLPISLVLIDPAGNISDAYISADASNRPGIDGHTPSISSVSFSQTSGVLKVGDSVILTISETGAETGLLAGNTMTVNGVDVSGTFSDIGGGNYTVSYTVAEGNTDILDSNDLPINITLQDLANNESSVFTTADAGNRPGVDGHTPGISSLSFVPTSGVLKIGDIATATISISGAETGLSAGTIVTINAVDVSATFSDIGGGDYEVVYTVTEGDNYIDDASGLPVNIQVQDSANNVSLSFTTADAENRPGVDGHKPNISQVSFVPSSGLLGVDDQATITVTTVEAGCSVTIATVNGIDISSSVVDNVDNTYTFIYTVTDTDNNILDSSDLPVSFTLTDSAGNVGDNYTTADAGNRPGVDSDLPSAPGNLTYSSHLNNSITLNFGSVSSDPNFSEYIIYYKVGTSGVTDADLAWDSSDDANLGNINFNVASDTTITGLATSTDYVFNIYAYDSSGNKIAATELSAKTNAYPNVPGSLTQYKSDGTTSIDNDSWIDEQSLVFVATSTDQDAGDDLDLYFQIASSSAPLITASTTVASTCSEGTDYNDCSSKVWEKSATSGWYDSAWLHRKKVTIDSSQVLSTETDFVVLATTTDTDLRDDARSDGFDILFTASDGTTKLDYERESFDNTTGDLVAWIETDVSSSVDTEIYIYYGNASASTDNSSSTAVWDSGYIGVWHLGEDPSVAVNDSSINANHMTADASMDSGNLIDGSIDANPANITNAIIPDILYGIGDTITATLTVSVDTDTYTLGVSSINGVSATNLQKINDTTYTLDYSMVEGHTDRASGTLPYSIVLIDSFANENPSYAGDFVDGAMDATRPVIASTYLTNGNYGIGDSMRLVVDSDGLEYSVFNITVNGQSINGFNDLVDTDVITVADTSTALIVTMVPAERPVSAPLIDIVAVAISPIFKTPDVGTKLKLLIPGVCPSTPGLFPASAVVKTLDSLFAKSCKVIFIGKSFESKISVLPSATVYETV